VFVTSCSYFEPKVETNQKVEKTEEIKKIQNNWKWFKGDSLWWEALNEISETSISTSTSNIKF